MAGQAEAAAGGGCARFRLGDSVPGTNVVLHDITHDEYQILSAVINGRVVFTDSGSTHQFKLTTGNQYTLQASADKSYDTLNCDSGIHSRWTEGDTNTGTTYYTI